MSRCKMCNAEYAKEQIACKECGKYICRKTMGKHKRICKNKIQ